MACKVLRCTDIVFITGAGSLCCSECEFLPVCDRSGMLGRQEGVPQVREMDHRQNQGAPREGAKDGGGGGGEVGEKEGGG